MNIKLHEYQKNAIKFILHKGRCLLFLDMGMGKTVITLTAIKALIEMKKVSRVLIIAPKFVAMNVWYNECLKWTHLKSLNIEVCAGKYWHKAILSNATIVVVNKENVCKLDLHCYDMLIIDEVTCIKDPSTKLFKHIKNNCFSYFVGLTGTPLTRGLQFIWALMYPVDFGARLGKTYYSFLQKYFYEINKYKLIPKNNSMLLITKAIKDCILILRVKGNIPKNEIIYINYEIEFDNKNKIEHDSIISKLVLFNEDGTPAKLMPSSAVALNNALQICNGCVYTHGQTFTVKHHLKYDALMEILETCDDNVLIAYQFMFDKMNIIETLSSKYNVRHLYTKSDIDNWNDRKIKVGLAQPKSLGKGVNLQTGGSIIIWFGLTWSLEDYEQFNARLARQGQRKPVRVINLVIKDSVETQVMKRMEYNKSLQSSFTKLLN